MSGKKFINPSFFVFLFSCRSESEKVKVEVKVEVVIELGVGNVIGVMVLPSCPVVGFQRWE